MPNICCVPQCNKQNKEVKFHRFPILDAEIYNIWITRINNSKIMGQDPKKVYKSYMVCDAHFSKHCHISSEYFSVSGLKKRSLPTLNLPGFNEPSTLENSFLPYKTPAITEENNDAKFSTRFVKQNTCAGENTSSVLLDTPVQEDPLDTTNMSEDAVTNIIVREAIREDMHQVYRLIKALAEFEKLQDQVKINPETLMQDGFDMNSPAFKCFVAELYDGPIIGYALYYTCYSTWLGKSIFLEDLYVDPAYRKCGVGKELILSVAKVAYETSKRLDFHVLSWNPAAEFYKSLGAINLTNSEQWQLYRLDESGLSKLFEK